MSDPDAPLPALRARRADAHKAAVGRVLVVGGTVGMAGAPALAARGALRAGAGLVTIAVPREILAIVASFLPEAMTVPLSSAGDGALDPSAMAVLAGHLERADAVVLGPGIGRAPATQAFVHAVLEKARCPVVLDADGLHAVGGRLAVLSARSAATVLTPHEGEAAALLGSDAKDVRAARGDTARRIAREARAVCVLKGPGTIVTDGDRLRTNRTGGPVLATGGTGDVLAGMVAAFLAGLPETGGDAFGAASIAVHAHGAAGDLLFARRGDRGVLASEIADAVPDVLRDLVQAGPPP